MLKSFMKENETEEVKKIRDLRQPLLDSRRSLIAEKNKLESALKALPGEILETEKILKDTNPLELGYEEFEKLQRKKFYEGKRKRRCKTNPRGSQTPVG